MISCSEYGIAMDVYNSVSQQWAEIVLDAQNQEVWVVMGRRVAPCIVAFHQQDCNDWAKVVSDRENSQVLASHGSNYYVKLCKDNILQLDAFNRNVPLQHASFVVAFHQIDRVRMIGFSKEGPARTVYNAISDDWAKILIPMDRRGSQDLLSHGDAISPSPGGTCFVAFHQKDCVRMIGLSIEGSAREIYDTISMSWAKILMDTRRSEVLMSYGSSEQIAPYIVAFHQNDRVRMLGFSEQQAACAASVCRCLRRVGQGSHE
ncbi:hypothetical protein EDD18DRAFT_1465212 [Armillaria luteobubalina]|uniref:Uncharacterized protein n=1 Tax=Armillaria luteobubalina TaxID=153913 RepID=A0AA39UQ76_9AGAR|nr:hypothetical protein EDD18DRAFT_1465212 [Armillaria luteobubalina]